MKQANVPASLLDILVSVLYVANKAAEGRTVIQKWCYFTSVQLGLQLVFSPHYYGPYSEPLSNAMASLIASDFLIERRRLTRTGRTVYCYELTTDGKALAKEIQQRSPTAHRVAKRVVRTCTSVVGNNISILSWAAKVYFILTERGRPVTYDEVSTLAKNLGWRLATKEIEPAMKLLRALKLAQESG